MYFIWETVIRGCDSFGILGIVLGIMSNVCQGIVELKYASQLSTGAMAKEVTANKRGRNSEETQDDLLRETNLL